MKRTLAKYLKIKALWFLCLCLLVAFCLLLVSLLAHSQRPSVKVKATDDFNRASGSLGRNWTRIRGGGLSISSRALIGSSGLSGDIWTSEKFPSDQYSQIEVTSARLKGSDWIGSAVRAQKGGLDGYIGLYNWNSGRPELMLLKRIGGNWAQLGDSYNSGPLAAGTQLKLMAVGSTISFLENGVPRLSVTDKSFSGGAPGIMIYGTGTVGNWSGGKAHANAPLQIHYKRTDANGVKWYEVISAANGPGPQVLRVLTPTNPAPGVPHNFLYVLPVQPGVSNRYSNGLQTLRRLDAQNRYNLTIIEPTFGTDPWYANNPRNLNVQYETFMTKQLVPWVKKKLAVSGHEQNWLIGFSKSGLGAQDLIFKHPDIFTFAASWDFPADMSSYDQLGVDPAESYGTNANFQANYRLTATFLNAHRDPFRNANRIWIGGNTEFPTDMSNYARLLAREGIIYTMDKPRLLAHSWNSGWVPVALAALRRDSERFLCAKQCGR